MNKRTLGNSDLSVVPLAFGGNVLGWTLDEKSSFRVLDAFVDAGFNFIDTANIYSRWKPGNAGGESETILGRWMTERKNRDKIVVATKVGGDMGSGKVNLTKTYIIEEVEASLRRLQTGYIDLYQSHFDDPDTSVGEPLEAFDTLIKQGKVRIIGASNFSASRFKEALDYSSENSIATYVTFQPEYNLYTREKFEKEYESLCLQKHLGVITYFSLASGFLTGKYRESKDSTKSVRGGSMGKYLNERGYRILNALDEVAAKHNSTPAAIALAWLLSRPAVTAPIASATSVEQVHELAQSLTITLDNSDIELLNLASQY